MYSTRIYLLPTTWTILSQFFSVSIMSSGRSSSEHKCTPIRLCFVLGFLTRKVGRSLIEPPPLFVCRSVIGLYLMYRNLESLFTECVFLLLLSISANNVKQKKNKRVFIFVMCTYIHISAALLEETNYVFIRFVTFLWILGCVGRAFVAFLSLRYL